LYLCTWRCGFSGKPARTKADDEIVCATQPPK
jgi:hypothetical protein